MALNLVALALLVYVGFLFALAAWGDRFAPRFDRSGNTRAILLALSLGVYCTSWTFYGAVGSAARDGWDFLPIYIGPILLFVFAFPLIRKLVKLGRQHDTGSIADFLAARFGKSSMVGGLAAGVLAIASLPYVALQLKSTGTSLDLLVGERADDIDWALLSAFAFGVFAMVFGTRKPDTSSGNRGLVLAIAFESVLKLVALIAVAVLVFAAWQNLPAITQDQAIQSTALRGFHIDMHFVVTTLLAALAALCLPRQFHMLIVENRHAGDEQLSRWVFPAYLAIFALLVVPITLFGTTVLSVEQADSWVLALPLSLNADAIALLAFMGGTAASTGMITITALALSSMLVDAIAAPILRQMGPGRRPRNLATQLLNYRRLTIMLFVLAAYLFYRGLNTQLALADIGLVSFAGAAQLAPALLFGLYWNRANRAGAIAGLTTGGIIWLVFVLAPAYSGYVIPLPGGADPFSWMTLFSLVANTLAFIIAVAFSPTHLTDRLQADRFSDLEPADETLSPNTVRLMDMTTLFEHVLGADGAREALADLTEFAGGRLQASQLLGPDLLDWCETRLARSVGAAAARILVAQVLPGGGLSTSDVVTLIDETTELIRSSETARAESERSAQFYMDHVPALISYADTQERILFANRAYLRYFGPDQDVVGQPISSYLSDKEYEGRKAYIERALSGRRAVFDIARAEGANGTRTWQVLYQPRVENDQVVGFFGVYQDITARRQAELALRESYETLEDKVRERTIELEEESARSLELLDDLELAHAQAEAATQSKTRFLAAASHDLLQPLSAARLLTSALSSELTSASNDTKSLLSRIDKSIANADQLLRALLDISRLDAGGVTPDPSAFSVDQLIEETAAPMAEKARLKGLKLTTVKSGLWATSDRGLMMSVLQNLIANAVRYTHTGGIAIGARRRGQNIALQVIDTGPGIPAHQRLRIFQEFERGTQARDDDRGLGLGLAIVDRILKRLDHPIMVMDGPKGGSIFEILLPRAEPRRVKPRSRRTRARGHDLTGVKVLCLDNDPDVLEGYKELLGRWGCTVFAVKTESEALKVSPDAPNLAIIDYQLDDGILGPDVFERLCAKWKTRPGAVLATAERGGHVGDAAKIRNMELITKPVSPAILRASLSALLARERQANPTESAEFS